VRSNDWRRPPYATVAVRFTVRTRSAIRATCRLTTNGRRSGLALLRSFSRGVAIARCRDGASRSRGKNGRRPLPSTPPRLARGRWRQPRRAPRCRRRPRRVASPPARSTEMIDAQPGVAWSGKRIDYRSPIWPSRKPPGAAQLGHWRRARDPREQ
jgi:hypothetical protein